MDTRISSNLHTYINDICFYNKNYKTYLNANSKQREHIITKSYIQYDNCEVFPLRFVICRIIKVCSETPSCIQIVFENFIEIPVLVSVYYYICLAFVLLCQ